MTNLDELRVKILAIPEVWAEDTYNGILALIEREVSKARIDELHKIYDNLGDDVKVFGYYNKRLPQLTTNKSKEK